MFVEGGSYSQPVFLLAGIVNVPRGVCVGLAVVLTARSTAEVCCFCHFVVTLYRRCVDCGGGGVFTLHSGHKLRLSTEKRVTTRKSPSTLAEKPSRFLPLLP